MRAQIENRMAHHVLLVEPASTTEPATGKLYLCYDRDDVQDCCSAIQSTRLITTNQDDCQHKLVAFGGRHVFTFGRWIPETSMDDMGTITEPIAINGEVKAHVDETDAWEPHFKAHRVSPIRSVLEGKGMHREWKFIIPRHTCSGSNVNFALFLPNGVFVENEDALRASSGSTVQWELDQLIDPEEPAWVCPAHSLVASVEGTEEEWLVTVPIHVRYQSPGSGYEKIVLPPPVFSCDKHQGMHDMYVASFSVLWTPVGSSTDYGVVLLITFVSALMGCTTMLRDILRLSLWR